MKAGRDLPSRLVESLAGVRHHVSNWFALKPNQFGPNLFRKTVFLQNSILIRPSRLSGQGHVHVGLVTKVGQKNSGQ